MGSLRLTLCAGAVVSATLTAPTASTASAAAAYAADSGDISVVPASPTPGSDIQVRAKGCGGKTGNAASKAFVADAQLARRSGGKGGVLSGETRVRSTLKPGTYEVRVTCDGKEDKVRGAITVGDGKPDASTPPSRPSGTPSRPSGTHSRPATKPSKPGTNPSKPAATPSKPAHNPSKPSAPASPVAPVRAGGGGAAAQLAADAANSANSTGSANSADSTDPENTMDARHNGPGTRHAVIGLVLAGVAAVAVVARSARRGRLPGRDGRE